MIKEFVCNGTEPVVATKYGRLRGFRWGETYHFYGIKYAKAKRWRMPEEVEPWEGVKDALSYGYKAPSLEPDSSDNLLKWPHRYWPTNEDCQYLNIWTPSIKEDAKKPVLVWIHGGIFSNGSAIESIVADGTSLSEFGDMVVVSVNHRLNLLGYFDLSSFGDQYWNTSNLGQADIVAALRWIQDNIVGFGGDPGNVTLMGQSGGGFKINALLQTPAADNLFHKAIIQSGLWWEDGLAGHHTPETSRMFAEGMIEELGLSTIEELEQVAFDKMLESYLIVTEKLGKQGLRAGFAPTKNDWYLGNPLDEGYFTEAAKRRPVIAGTILGEFDFWPQVQNKHTLTEEERYDVVKAKYGENTDPVLALFQKAYPDKNITDAVMVDTHFRKPALDWLDARAQAGCADTYSYVFALDFTMNGGKVAWHGAELPFVFHNADMVPITGIPGTAEKLEAQIAGAWVNFARTGNPNNPETPEWKPYRVGDEVTMVFSEESAAKVNYDKELIETLKKVAPVKF